MEKILKKLSSFSPSVILAGLAPWFEPFQRLSIIHSQWRPEIDIAVNVISAITAVFCYATTKGKNKKQLRKYIKVLFISIFVSFFISFIIGKRLIYNISVDYVIFGEILWGAFYIIGFIALTCFFNNNHKGYI